MFAFGFILIFTLLGMEIYSKSMPLPSRRFLDCQQHAEKSFGKESYIRELEWACGDKEDSGRDLFTAIREDYTPW